MKLLIVSPSIPFPLVNGGHVAQFSMLRYLQHHINIDYCLVVWDIHQMETVEKLKKELPKINFIVINQVTVETKQSKSVFSQFWRRLILLFKTKTTKKAKTISKNIDEFKDNQPALLHIKTEKYIDELHKVLSKDCWDIIQTEFYEMIDLVTFFPQKAKKVFVSHESRTLRLDSAKEYSKATKPFTNYLIHLNKHIEVSFLNEYDQVIVFSYEDEKRLTGFGVKNISVSPFTIIEDYKKVKPFEQLDKIFFLGGSNHSPNVEGLQWFISEIYPEIYKKHQLPLHIIGNWSEKAKISSDVGTVVYLGYVENLNPIIKNAAMIVPIRVGNGIRTKIIVGLESKIPIVTTALGVEGIGLKDELNILIADGKQSFFDKIELLKNSKSDDVHRLVDNGYEFYETNFSLEALGNKRLEVYKNLLD